MTASRFMTPCGSPHWGSCFAGDTQVLTREIEDATITAAVHPDQSQSDSSLDWLTPVCILIGVAGTFILQRKRRRRLRPVAARRSPLDQVFSAEDLRSLQPQLKSQRRKMSQRHDRSISEVLPTSPSITMNDTSYVDIHEQHANRHEPSLAYAKADGEFFENSEGSDRWKPTTWAWMLLWLAISGFLFVQSKATSWSVPVQAKATSTTPTVGKRFESRAIQDIRTGMRVIADNPELNGQDVLESNINPETWRNIHLSLDKPDGSQLRMTLLRPLDWLYDRQAIVGRDIDVNLQELGVAGSATILTIEPCPPIEGGSGRVVTGTFQHTAANVIDLHVSGEMKPIGTTSNHPIWSEDRQKFVPAGGLRPGELLRTATRKTLFVTKIVPRIGTETVFNLEVESEHAYAITSRGIIVHNSYVPDEVPRYVYRGLSHLDNIADGLVARAPNAVDVSPLSHVAGKIDSPWISTSASDAIAINKYGQQFGAIRIDLSQVNGEIVDLRGGITQGGRFSSWAKSDSEILIRGFIPPSAIEVIFTP